MELKYTSSKPLDRLNEARGTLHTRHLHVSSQTGNTMQKKSVPCTSAYDSPRNHGTPAQGDARAIPINTHGHTEKNRKHNQNKKHRKTAPTLATYVAATTPRPPILYFYNTLNRDFLTRPVTISVTGCSTCQQPQQTKQ